MKKKNPRKDLYDTCYDGRLDKETFDNMFCRRCRNPECERSMASEFSWIDRMANQMSVLFDDRVTLDPTDPQYQVYEKMVQGFDDMLEHAQKIEVSSRSWEVPEFQITDGKDEAATKESQKSFDDSLDALKIKKKKKEKPTHFVAEEEEPQVVEKPPVVEEKKLPERPQRVQQNTPLQNTTVPSGGIMLDGAESKPITPQKKEVQDTWEVPKEKIIPVGGTVVIQKKSSENS